MTSFYEDLHTFLVNSEAVVALVIDRIHPMKLPQTPTLPAIVPSRINLGKVHSHDGDSGLDTHLYQLKCYAKTHRAANALADVVEALLSGYKGVFGTRVLGASFVISRKDDIDPTTDLYAQILEIRFHEEG